MENCSQNNTNKDTGHVVVIQLQLMTSKGINYVWLYDNLGLLRRFLGFDLLYKVVGVGWA